MNNISPACRPTVCEKQYDYIRDSTFYRPSFVIYRNNEPLSVNDDFNIDYSYAIASYILSHLKAVSSDRFTIKPLAWTPIFDYRLSEEGQA